MYKYRVKLFHIAVFKIREADSRAGQGYSDVLCHPAYGNVTCGSGEAQVPILQMVQVTSYFTAGIYTCYQGH